MKRGTDSRGDRSFVTSPTSDGFLAGKATVTQTLAYVAGEGSSFLPSLAVPPTPRDCVHAAKP
jgi:hypothetical protein